MFPLKINTPSGSFRVLVAPLDWGLGHATRCIPVIKALKNEGAEVIIAADGAIASLLKNEFPSLEFISLAGYNITYGKGAFLKLRLLLKYFTIKKRIRSEHKWLQQIIKEKNINAVISDNR